MKLRTTLLCLALTAGMPLLAQQFDEHFQDTTLRLDYIFAGDADSQHIFLDELSATPRWYGKRQRMSEVPVAGTGTITVSHPETGETLYLHPFSTLFQEWLSTEEAKHTKRSFENVFLIPYPRHDVNVTIELRDFHHATMARMTHTVSPADILIRQRRQQTPYVTLQQAADTAQCIHIAYVAEGYATDEMDQFLADCQTAMEALFEHEPFKAKRHAFNVIAVKAESEESGVSEPGNHLWRRTALGSHFDTFYSQRYLTTLRLKRLHDILAATPYEHIIILANTKHYGGGGILNSYNLAYTRGHNFRPVVVHEFGHSFGGLADEYPYGDDDPMYFPDTEPWEANLTTSTEYPVKWQALIDTGEAGLVEGGGYLSKGVWRAQADCRMRTNEYPTFCPVCQKALSSLIDFYTSK